MSQNAAPAQVLAHEVSALPGAVIVARIRNLVIAAVVAWAVYSTFTHGQKSACADSSAAVDASFLNRCVELRLAPSPLVAIAVIAIVLLALRRVLRTAVVEADALRILDRATVIIGAVTLGSLIIGLVWFALIPVPDPSGPISVVYPFPFASGELIFTP